MFFTGITACNELQGFYPQGNIVPHSWFQTIIRNGLKKPKPHLLAINIWAEVVYWYRPVEVRNEATGVLLGYRKKFKADLLQLSYGDLAEKFGQSKETVRDAVVFLKMWASFAANSAT